VRNCAHCVATEISRSCPLWVAGKYDDFSLRNETLPTCHCAVKTDDFSFRNENLPFSFHQIAAPLEP
jgi:hypothetical protein